VLLDLEPLPEPEEENRAEAEPAADLAGKRALLVEDNEINAEIARMILGQFGLEVDWAENGEIGVNILQHMGQGYYDVVLMDIQMPVMNGYEAARAIRALPGGYYGGIPIIAMSANAYDEDVRDCLEAGMNAHVAKPFDPEQLRKVIAAWMFGEGNK
ncbi:MAG: response regulator, partial [Clostridia bacterium]|nr:response regulator [Clostridia bacterium]